MEHASGSTSRTPNIPRPSRLPVARVGPLKSISSKGALHMPTASGIATPGLRTRTSEPALRSAAASYRGTDTQVFVPNGPDGSDNKNLDHVVNSLTSTGRHNVKSGMPGKDLQLLNSDQESVEPLKALGVRKPRLSLSERALGTLAQIPASPAVRRKSSFYNNESPMCTASSIRKLRSSSNCQQDCAIHSAITPLRLRRTSNVGGDDEAALPKDAKRSMHKDGVMLFEPLPSSREFTKPGSLQNPGKMKSTSSLKSAYAIAAKPESRHRSPRKTPVNCTRVDNDLVTQSDTKPCNIGPLMPKIQTAEHPEDPSPPGVTHKSDIVLKGSRPPNPNRYELGPTSQKTKSVSVTKDDAQHTSSKSSSALRDQIIRAKAAKRAQMAANSAVTITKTSEADTAIIPTASFDFGLAANPLCTILSGDNVLQARCRSARTDGRLNISAMGLTEMPAEVMDMYNMKSLDDGSWAECVDLVRLVAADNEFEDLDGELFPDCLGVEDTDDGDVRTSIFGGLEAIDLHGNLLRSIPTGLRRLQLLTTLDLSRNRLTDDCLEIISQMSSLSSLKLAYNTLTGIQSIAKLRSLKVLDVSENQIVTLPRDIENLTCLRTLNVAGNHLTDLPIRMLSDLPLVTLFAHRNRLSGVLVDDVEALEMSNLVEVDISMNALSLVAKSSLRLPRVQQFSCSANRLAALPDVSTWASMVTLLASDNKIESVPEGFVSRPRLRTADLTGNEIMTLDDRIGLMTSLDALLISGNPLKEKKFSSMATADLKHILLGRIEHESLSPTPEGSCDSTDTIRGASNASGTEVLSHVIKAGHLDLSRCSISSWDTDDYQSVVGLAAVQALILNYNALLKIPTTVSQLGSSLVSLSLTNNLLKESHYLDTRLAMPALRELNISANSISSLIPLAAYLESPCLEKLDVSFNRLIEIVPLRSTFPALTTLIAGNNAIAHLSSDTVCGLHVIDCSNNNLTHLDPTLGLLGGPGGLKRLDVRGNRFRVPRYTVLEKGTEATLAWLRDRIPDEHVAER